MKHFLISIVSSLVVCCGLLWVYDQHVALKIATIDMQGYVETLQSGYMQGQIPKQQLDDRLKQLSDQIRENYSSNTILLLEEVVVSGDFATFEPEIR
ncbi:MAG: hypothetical protein AVO38_03545 [delta proteobacterium ML8_D]|nr:MAG: hypothetical protein AVO38_03545 [delta proteobacterium ML8_D]